MALPDKFPAEVAAIERAVDAARVVGLLTHRRPDGDALGSCIALAEALRGLGKEVHVVNEDPPPESLAFLRGVEQVEVAAGMAGPRPVDLVFALDAAGEDRIGEAAWAAFRNAGPVVNIDHHVSNSRFGDINLVDAVSPATGQIVYELAAACDWPLTDIARDALFAAVSTDTGSFRYPSTTADTYRMAADLVDRGLDVGVMSGQLYENYSLRRLLLLRDLLESLEVRAGGRVAAVKLPLEKAREAGVTPGDTDGITDVVRSVGDIIVSVFFEEMADGKIRVSARSKSARADVSEICGVFGGGGHKLAAGARMPGPLDEAARRFLSEVEHRIDATDGEH